MATGEGGSLPSLSMVLRRGGLWGESSLILYYCYFWPHRGRFQHVRPKYFYF